jgi:hypothetical protein
MRRHISAFSSFTGSSLASDDLFGGQGLPKVVLGGELARPLTSEEVLLG